MLTRWHLRCPHRQGTCYKYEVECNTGAICLCNKPWADSGFKIKTNVSDVWQHRPTTALTSFFVVLYGQIWCFASEVLPSIPNLISEETFCLRCLHSSTDHHQVLPWASPSTSPGAGRGGLGLCFEWTESRCWFVWCLGWSLDSLLGFWNELSNRWLGVHGSFGFRFSSLGMISLLSLAHLFPWAWLFLVAEDKDLSYCCIPLRRAALHSTVLSSSLQFSLLAERDLAEGAGGCLWCLLAGRRALKALRQLPPWNTTVLVSMPALCVLKRLPGWDGWQPSSVSQRAGGVGERGLGRSLLLLQVSNALRPPLLHPVLFVFLQKCPASWSVAALSAAVQKTRSPWTRKISVSLLRCMIKR